MKEPSYTHERKHDTTVRLSDAVTTNMRKHTLDISRLAAIAMGVLYNDILWHGWSCLICLLLPHTHTLQVSRVTRCMMEASQPEV